MQLQFTKMHGLGNDFVVLDGITESLSLTPCVVKMLCDRRRGVGCDQVLLIEPPTQTDVDFGYRIFNADGGEVGQCGNGTRCVAHFVQAKGWVRGNAPIRVQTKTQLMTLELLADGRVSVLMGVPDFTPAKVPICTDESGPEHKVHLNGDKVIEFVALSMGNPHAVIFTPSVAKADVCTIGAALQAAELTFPEQVNVGFCEVVDRCNIKLRVYERGVGETMACGSGACAAVAAGRKLGLLEESVSVSLTGGDLQINWSDMAGELMMTGSAKRVYEGYIEL